jgi:O-acetylhomoserine (thiol)-lyase
MYTRVFQTRLLPFSNSALPRLRAVLQRQPTASGMAALAVAIMTICSQGDHIVASSRMYGANINLLENTLPRFGITTSFVDPTNVAAIEAAIQPNTKIVFGEVIGNPGLDIMDVEVVAKVTAKAGVPLMLDCTFNTPWLLKPFRLVRILSFIH